MQRFTLLVHAAFHRPDTQIYKVSQGLIWGLILVSIASLVIEPLVPETSTTVLSILGALEVSFLVIFGLEYIGRVATYRPPALKVFRAGPLWTVRTHLMSRLRYALQPMMLIDLLAVIAFFPELRSLRALRLLRLLRTAKLFQYSNPVVSLINALEQNGLLFGFSLSVLLSETLVGGVSLYLVERGANPDVQTLGDGLWWALVTLTTVGFGDISPVTGMGRIVGSALMIAGLFTLALFAGAVGSSLVGTITGIREEQFRMGEYVNHIVVCGYDKSTDLLLDLVDEEVGATPTRIVVFDERDRPPECKAEFLWVKGSPAKQSELDKVRLTHAQAVIVVGSREISPQAADANTLLTVFTIRSYLEEHAELMSERLAPLYVVAEILDSENVRHARTAGADEVIETRRLGFSMIAHTITNHHTAHTLSRVAMAGSVRIFIGEIPDGLQAPEPYVALLRRLKLNDKGALVIGVVPPDTEDELFNPPPDYMVEPGTTLIYLSEDAVLAPAL